MRGLALTFLLAACYDYDHFRTQPGDLSFAADLAVADLARADLTGCPAPGLLPSMTAGCTLYTFESGIPVALKVVNPTGTTLVQPECNLLHVQVPSGASHDFWIDNLDAFRLEEITARSGPFTVSARIHGALVTYQQFSGIYARDGVDRFISVQTSADGNALHDHDVVFEFGAPAGEQSNYPDANVAAGDSYLYRLSRASDTFTLEGSQSMDLKVLTTAALNLGVVVGNCCGVDAPALDAWVEWMMVCQ